VIKKEGGEDEPRNNDPGEKHRENTAHVAKQPANNGLIGKALGGERERVDDD
jgi:hypothetical protein